MTLSGAPVRWEGVDRGDQLDDLLSGEHVRDEVVVGHWYLWSARNVCFNSVPDEELRKAAYLVSVVLTGLRTLMRLSLEPSFNNSFRERRAFVAHVDQVAIECAEQKGLVLVSVAKGALFSDELLHV
jgi:hypothetical protein